MDIYEELAEAILAIKSDKNLKESFLKILEVGSYSQQVRVEKIYNEVIKFDPPAEVTLVLNLLKDDKIANLVYRELAQ
ncbi:MAG: hypothetical protein CL677_09220 [Bdellovibrionaceae bacterium]|nr:hypothetical protein [Pseudobdellovibrionaceae bacterium]|tara:strand:- start:58546 stop:58779 length:234 start_codon:yes stop_codon:yes gene_type:complete